MGCYGVCRDDGLGWALNLDHNNLVFMIFCIVQSKNERRTP